VALPIFASRGSSATTLKMVADAAGVSIGLVQHHFGTKKGLVRAVDQRAFDVLGAAMGAPLPRPPDEAVTEVGQRVTSLIADYPAAVDYLGRALIEGNPPGDAMFDALVRIGLGQWSELAEQQATRPDLDITWAALNPLVLVLGAVILRRHTERQLPEPFPSPRQLHRWAEAVNGLLRAGQLHN
jgi:AcrR family transcriptional regulator